MSFYRKFSFWAFVLLSVLVVLFIYKNLTVSIPVKTESARRQALHITVSATSAGTVRSEQEIHITAQRAGRISDLFIDEGDRVEAGGRIAEIDPAEARINLELTQASYKKAKALLAQLESSYEAFEVEVRTSIEGIEARLRDIEDKYEKYRELKKQGYVSQMEFNELESQYRIVKTEHEAAIARKSTLAARKQEIIAQQATIREAKSNLELAELNYAYSFVNAPEDGVITSRPVQLGKTVLKGELLAVLTVTKSLYIEAFVDEADVAKVELAQKVEITMDAYPNRVFGGTVTRISPVVLGGRLETRTFEVRTMLNDKDVVLKPGMSADVEIVVQSVPETLVVPTQAVINREGKHYVYVVDGNRVRWESIETGLADWTFTQVVSGLDKGQHVVVTPDVPGLEDGARINVLSDK